MALRCSPFFPENEYLSDRGRIVFGVQPLFVPDALVVEIIERNGLRLQQRDHAQFPASAISWGNSPVLARVRPVWQVCPAFKRSAPFWSSGNAEMRTRIPTRSRCQTPWPVSMWLWGMHRTCMKSNHQKPQATTKLPTIAHAQGPNLWS